MSWSSEIESSQMIEHIVLFKIKDGADSDKIDYIFNGLNGLVRLDQVLQLSAGPVHQLRSASAFTHVLHSRYGSKQDLGAYAVHPDHVSLVKESAPIVEDIMAVDWITDRTIAPPPSSVAKITLLKLKENVPDEVKMEFVEVTKGLHEKVSGIEHFTVGENFSPARAKGFSIGSIAYFRDVGEMDAHKELVNLLKDKKVGDYVDDTIVVDFLVPSVETPQL
uniref:Stress-response A/B barrel domain-containing protein n=1 Tax=Noccaea caerulescens TaxID=107243 RepID=A0A1J3FRE6_NOCCA